VHALEARYRWALSGTPLQNRVTELYSQIRFLRVFPFAVRRFFYRFCYFKKGGW
jgi:SNF2 family DNA or RNA helicase